MRALTATALLSCLLAAPQLLAADSGYSDRYAGQRIVRVHPETFRDLRAAMTLADDVWTHSPAVGRPLDLAVDAESLAALRRAGFTPETVIADLAAVVAAEKARLDEGAASAGEGGIAGDDVWFSDFKPLAAINDKLDQFVSERPDLVTPFTIGLSLEGRPIRGIRISSAPAGSPAILFNGCQHAREWISPMTVMYIANELVDNASTDPDVAEVLARFEVFIVPVVNPDGYQYSWDVERLWRKNRRNNGDGSFGVDLNRNWAFAWGGPGSGSSPSAETYRGPAPFSEPESQALRDFYLAQPNIIASIDFHSFSQLVLSPWGWTTEPAADSALFDTIGSGMAGAVLETSGFTYVSGPIGPTLYLASGNIVDWAYGERDAIAYTIELRDTGEFGFILPPDQILPTGVETFAAMRSFFDDLSAPASVVLTEEAPSTIVVDEAFVVNVRIRELAGEVIPGSERLWSRIAGETVFTATNLTGNAEDPNAWSSLLPAARCGSTIEWYVEAQTNLGAVRSPADAPASFYATTVVGLDVTVDDAFETDLGWTIGAAGDNALSGIWTRVDPNGTTAQPENDSSVDGTLCFVTGQGVPGGAAGAADVDGGSTTLLSPVLDCSHPESYIRYDRWYSNNLGGAPNSDSMPIELTTNGTTWTALELVTENTGTWVTKTFRVADFVSPSPTVRVRFVARDLGQGSLVEAGVDEFQVYVAACPDVVADLNGDGEVNGADLAILLGLWGSRGGPADLDGSGEVDGGDLAILLGAWG